MKIKKIMIFLLTFTVATASFVLSIKNISYAEYKQAQTTSNVNVRRGPNISYKIITPLKKGTTVEIIETKEGWSKIKQGSIVGYSSTKYLKETKLSNKPAANPANLNNGSSLNNKSTYTSNKKMQVTVSSLNIRDKASTNGKVLGKLSKGVLVDVIEIKNGWASIKYKNKTTYISSQYLKNISTTNPASSNNGSSLNNKPTDTSNKKMQVTASSLNIRDKASTNGKVLGKLSKGASVDVIEIKNGWASIKYKNKTTYISSQYLKDISTSTPSKESFVSSLNVAKQAKQIITVVGTSGYNTNVILHEKDTNGKWKETLSVKGTVGTKGIGTVKEGSKMTPEGVHGFTFAFGNASNPGTTFEYRKVNKNHYWIDDPKSIHYNKWVDVTKVKKDWNSAEYLSSYQSQYKYVLALDYNYYNATPGNGSAFFLHVGNGKPTAGCVAIPEQNMINILNKIKPGAKIVISKNMDTIKKY